MIKKAINDLLDRLEKLRGKSTESSEAAIQASLVELNTGNLVRVRTEEEIAATLNHWGQLKGCSFAPEMKQYCGTTQKVLKPVERFVDERDFRVRKTKGIVLLQGINCQGTASLGKCDRNCYYFWRIEWLDKISET